MHLIADDVGFAYPGRPVLEHVDVRVSAGVRLGVVGENGSGKSTLLRVLAGSVAPTSGTVRRQGTLTVVEQELEATPGRTVGDLVAESLAVVRGAAAGLEAATTALDEQQRADALSRRDLDEYATLLARAEHLAAWDADRRIDVALTRLGAHRDPGRRLDTLSVGERYRVRLACRLAERSDLLLLDEPTNHLDDSAIAFLTAELRAWRGGVVLVTHDREMLDDVVTAMLDLDPSMDGRPVLYGVPGYWPYRLAKDAALARWRQRYNAERKRAARLAARLDESYEGLSDEWRPEKGSQKHRRATRARIHVKAADRLVQRLEAEAVDVPVPPEPLHFPDLPVLPKGADGSVPLVELKGPVVRGVARGGDDRPGAASRGSGPSERASSVPAPSDRGEVGSGPGAGAQGAGAAGAREPEAGAHLGSGAGGRARLDLRGQRVVLPPSGRLLVTGPNGAGKSTLLKALAGTLPLDGGVRTVVPGTRFGVVAQEVSDQDDADRDEEARAAPARGATGFDECAREAYALLAQGRLDPEQVVSVAFLGLLSEEDLDRPLTELSTGQRRRFELARSLVAAPHVLIVDEPTNHLSIDLVDQLTRALLRTSAAVVVATHDRRMRKDLADWPTLRLG